MADRLQFRLAAFVVVTKDNCVLLNQRKNSGFLDDYYDLPAGHVELGETLKEAAKRELSEETSLAVALDDLELIHISQNNMTPELPYLYITFRANRWSGTPSITESHRAADQRFFALDELPDKVTPYTARVLEDLGSKEVGFSYFGPEDLPS